MRIAVVSDTHSKHATILQVLALIEEAGVTQILHCGDLEDADAVRHFPRGTHFVHGNCDRERSLIARTVETIGGVLDPNFAHLELAGKTLAVTHGDDGRLLQDLIASQAYDYIFHGHTHVPRDERIGKTRVINPGALHRANPRQFAFLDLITGELETVRVE